MCAMNWPIGLVSTHGADVTHVPAATLGERCGKLANWIQLNP
jgi:hypothetical protein